MLFFFSSRRRHTRFDCDWSSDVCSSDLLHGLNTLRYQPIKISAMEGRWETMRAAPFTLFALPSMEHETNYYALDIPKLRSEERRVGKECRSQWWQVHDKEKNRHDCEMHG